MKPIRYLTGFLALTLTLHSLGAFALQMPSAPAAPGDAPPGFAPQINQVAICADNDKVQDACQEAKNYCDAALEDWDNPGGMTKNNLLHCAYFANRCNRYVEKLGVRLNHDLGCDS